MKKSPINANHPFIFFIWDTFNHHIFLMGKLSDPGLVGITNFFLKKQNKIFLIFTYRIQ